MITWLMLIFKLNLGDSQLICKSIGMLQGISIFVSLLAVQIEFDLLEKNLQVSTISITAIALDRYHVSGQQIQLWH